MGLVDFSRRDGSRAACGACAWIAPSGAGFIRDPEGEALAKTALMASISGVRYSVYVALTNIPEGELLTGFAMRSDPNVVFG